MDDSENARQASKTSRLPDRLRAANSATEIDQETALPEPSTWQPQIRRRLSDYFWPQLPFAQLVDEVGPRSHDQLAHAATASLGKIQQWRKEIRRFLETICACSIEYRSQGKEVPAFRQQAFDSRYQLLLSSLPPTPSSPNLLTAALMAKPLEEVCRTVEDNLRQQCVSLADGLLQALDALSEIKIVGRIERLGNACRLNFGRQVIIQGAPTKNTWTESYSTDHSTVEDQYVRTGARVEYRLGYHEHHVMNFREELLDESTVEVPAQYSPLLETVPMYVRPLLCLVEGDLFRELIIEKELEVDFLETTVVTRTVREHATAVSYDPAIVLGDYVLTGWGSREIREQEALQETERQKARNRRCRQYSVLFGVASALLMIVGTGLLFSSRTASLHSLTPAALTTLLAMVVAYFSLEQYTRSRQQRDSVWFPFVTAMAIAMLAFTIQLAIAAFLFKSWWPIGGGLLTFLLALMAVGIAGDRLHGK